MMKEERKKLNKKWLAHRLVVPKRIILPGALVEEEEGVILALL